MKTNIRLLRKHRVFSEEFKKDIVREFESGQYSVAQLSKLHQLQKQVVYTWIHKYSTFNSKGYRMVEKSQSSTEKVKQLEKRIQELEQAVGKKQIMIDYLEQMMIVAKEELNIDIKKNFGTPPSKGSDKK